MGLLEGYFVPLHSFFLTPDSFEQKVLNVSFAFELMQDGGLEKPKPRPEDIVNCDLKSTLRVLYNLFTKYRNVEWGSDWTIPGSALSCLLLSPALCSPPSPAALFSEIVGTEIRKEMTSMGWPDLLGSEADPSWYQVQISFCVIWNQLRHHSPSTHLPTLTRWKQR